MMEGTQSSKLTSDHHTAANGDGGDVSVEVLSREPRLSLYHNLLSEKECEHLINLAKPHLKQSQVFADDTTGEGIVSSIRTSSEATILNGGDQIIRGIEERIAKWTFLPLDNGGHLQVINYKVGEKCHLHCDFLQRRCTTLNLKYGERMATVLMYLSDVEEGGETVFPKAKKLPTDDGQGISVKPKMGDALLFWNMKPDGSLDHLSCHGASPVIKGDKWCCRKWFHVNKYLQ